MSAIKSAKLNVYYDGLCPMCSFEIDHYKKHRNSHMIRFVDIAGQDFNATSEGLDPEKVHKEFHVKTHNGDVIAGVDAFVEIWRTLGVFGRLDKLVNFPVLRPIVNIGYIGFAKIRPWFRRKPVDCDDNVCQQKVY